MTPYERALDIVMTKDVSAEDIEGAIVAAIEEEREACVEIARDEIGDEFADPFSRLGETIRRIVSKIRARSALIT